MQLSSVKNHSILVEENGYFHPYSSMYCGSLFFEVDDLLQHVEDTVF